MVYLNKYFFLTQAEFKVDLKALRYVIWDIQAASSFQQGEKEIKENALALKCLGLK